MLDLYGWYGVETVVVAERITEERRNPCEGHPLKTLHKSQSGTRSGQTFEDAGDLVIPLTTRLKPPWATGLHSPRYGEELAFVSNASLREDARSTSIGELLRSFSCTASVSCKRTARLRMSWKTCRVRWRPDDHSVRPHQGSGGESALLLHAYKRSQEVGYHDCAVEEDLSRGLCKP